MKSMLKWMPVILFTSLATLANASDSLPQRGMIMTDVALHFGEPTQKLAAVGNPPITRWVYPGYIVYFQGDYVINSVATSATAGTPTSPH